MFKLNVYRTTFTENEVFGTSCGDCGWTSYAAITPNVCGGCGATREDGRLESAEGCEIPYDDDHVTRSVESFDTAAECAEWLRREGLTEWAGSWWSDPDGSRITDYAIGEREEVLAHPADDMTAGEIDAVAAAV